MGGGEEEIKGSVPGLRHKITGQKGVSRIHQLEEQFGGKSRNVKPSDRGERAETMLKGREALLGGGRVSRVLGGEGHLGWSLRLDDKMHREAGGPQMLSSQSEQEKTQTKGA